MTSLPRSWARTSPVPVHMTRSPTSKTNTRSPEEAQPEVTEPEDDLDEYAKWAAEAAAKATSGEMPVTPAPKPHKPIPMPVPESLKHTKHE